MHYAGAAFDLDRLYTLANKHGIANAKRLLDWISTVAMSETTMLAGAASALAWRLKRPDVALYNTIGELKYDLAYPDSVKQRVDPDNVQQ